MLQRAAAALPRIDSWDIGISVVSIAVGGIMGVWWGVLAFGIGLCISGLLVALRGT